MKVARVRYTGRKGEHTRRLPSGEKLRFRRRDRSDPWVIVEDPDDARRLEDLRNYEVKWTARGRLLVHGAEVLSLGYQKKRSLASDLDLSFDGHPNEQELDKEIEEMINTLETQRGL